MPSEFSPEEKVLAEEIKSHWNRHYRAWYKALADEGQETLDGWALNWAWDMLQQVKGYEAGGLCREMAYSEAWYGMNSDCRHVNEQARQEAEHRRYGAKRHLSP